MIGTDAATIGRMSMIVRGARERWSARGVMSVVRTQGIGIRRWTTGTRRLGVGVGRVL